MTDLMSQLEQNAGWDGEKDETPWAIWGPIGVLYAGTVLSVRTGVPDYKRGTKEKIGEQILVKLRLDRDVDAMGSEAGAVHYAAGTEVNVAIRKGGTTRAVIEALKAAGATSMDEGGFFWIRFASVTKTENGNTPKNYEAGYTPPAGPPVLAALEAQQAPTAPAAAVAAPVVAAPVPAAPVAPVVAPAPAPAPAGTALADVLAGITPAS